MIQTYMEILQPMLTYLHSVVVFIELDKTANTYLKDVLLINIFFASMMQAISEEISQIIVVDFNIENPLATS